MPTDAGTVTAVETDSGLDALGDTATVTVAAALAAVEKIADRATDVWAVDAYPSLEGTTHSGTATNSGAHTAHPVVTITGPGSNPVIRNTTTGDKMAWDSITLADTDTLIADCRTHQVSLNGLAAPSPLGWLTLAPGANAITVICAGPAPGFSCDLNWSDRWES